MSARLADGRKVRILTVPDVFTREALAVRADTRFTADMVVRVLDNLKTWRGRPKSLRVDNGPELAGRMLDLWAYCNQVVLDFSRPATPTDNAFIESFNGKFRDECLDVHWFLCLDEARTRIEAWRGDCNRERPHSAVGNLPSRSSLLNRPGGKGQITVKDSQNAGPRMGSMSTGFRVRLERDAPAGGRRVQTTRRRRMNFRPGIARSSASRRSWARVPGDRAGCANRVYPGRVTPQEPAGKSEKCSRTAFLSGSRVGGQRCVEHRIGAFS